MADDWRVYILTTVQAFAIYNKHEPCGRVHMSMVNVQKAQEYIDPG